MISFVAIAIPMTFILFNEFIGDAMVDAFLPAMYSSVFFLGAFLYTLSIAALLMTFVFLLAAANYWAFVYHPASLAHSRRKLKLKRISRDGPPVRKSKRSGSTYPTNLVERSKSFFSPLVVYFVRVFHIVKRSVQHGITLVSFRRIRHTKSLAAKRVWCGMNRPLLLQGTVQSIASVRSSTTKARKSRLHRKSSTHFVPDCVTGMTANSSMRTLQLVRAQSGYRHFAESVDQSDLSEEPVVTITGGIFKARRVLAPRILFQAQQVFNHLRSNLADSIEERADEGLEVSEALLTEEVRKVLDVFYPDGIAFTAAEKTEAFDLFESWKESVREQFVLRLTKTSIDEERVIRFSLFEKWFTREITSVIHNTMSDRLMESPMVTSVNVTNIPGNRNSALLRIKHTGSDLRLNI